MSHLIPSIGLGVSFILLVVEGRCRFVPFCTYVFVLQWFWCFCLELLGGKSLISGKPLMCWRISTCSSPKGLAWTWICAVRRSLLVYNQDFSSQVILFCSFCAEIVRGWRMQVQQITSRQADSQDLASPSNMPYNNPKIWIQLVVAPSEYKKKRIS